MLSHNIAVMIDTLHAIESLAPALSHAARLVTESLKSGGKLLTCGNGGSAADAMHLATEFVVRYHHDRRPYPAIALTANGGDLTAIGNDYTFDDLFARQVRAFGKHGDVLIVFTTSGKSRNIERALQAAKEAGVKSIAFLGRDGGSCRQLADIELLVPGTLSARIQEAHKVLLHTLCEIVEREL
jgi:D-sedoheptulose 7-phosphate isomerase